MPAWTAPEADDFKAFFVRDFKYAPESAPDDLAYITDSDIDRAIAEAELNFNSSLFGTDAQVTNVFMYLAAFYLVWNIQNSSQGLGAQFNFPVTNKSVGGVSIGFQVPERIMEHPTLSIYASNGYGMKYLQLALPWTIGNVSVADGQTTVN